MAETASLLPFPSKIQQDAVSDTWLERCTTLLSDIIQELIFSGGDMDFEDLSNKLFARSKDLTGEILKGAIEERVKSSGSPARHPCPHCHNLARAKGSKERTIETRHGPVTFSRPYYHCSSCSQGFFPADDDLKLAAELKQYDLGRIAMEFLAKLPYAEAAHLFKVSTGETFSDHCVHGLAASVGEQATLERVLPTKDQIDAIVNQYSEQHRKPILVVSADGAHEPLRPEVGTREGERGSGYWKEAKGFRIYLCHDERIEQIASWHQICDEAEFGETIQFAATLIPADKLRIALVADGAHWIWKHLKEAFPEGREILDYYHLSEHIHKLADVQYADNTEMARQWCESTLARLNFGEVDAVIWGLERMKSHSDNAREEINKLVTYLRNNHDRINCQRNRYGSYPNGSGGIESANKYICHLRLKRPGAWWYETNANKMLRIRCAQYNGRLDNLIQLHKINSKGRKKRSRKRAPKR
jgi:hypothetical protein